PHLPRRALHSFPTRRSSDLKLREAQGLSDDVTVYFHGPNVPEASITPIVFGFAKNPLYAKASSNWYRQSGAFAPLPPVSPLRYPDRKSTRLNSSHVSISYAV